MAFIKHIPNNPVYQDNTPQVWIDKTCKDPSHNPPNMIVLKPGVHVWQCPRCKKEQTICIGVSKLVQWAYSEPENSA